MFVTIINSILRKFYKGSQKPKEWAEELSTVIREKYSQKAVSEIYTKVMNGKL